MYYNDTKGCLRKYAREEFWKVISKVKGRIIRMDNFYKKTCVNITGR